MERENNHFLCWLGRSEKCLRKKIRTSLLNYFTSQVVMFSEYIFLWYSVCLAHRNIFTFWCVFHPGKYIFLPITQSVYCITINITSLLLSLTCSQTFPPKYLEGLVDQQTRPLYCKQSADCIAIGHLFSLIYQPIISHNTSAWAPHVSEPQLTVVWFAEIK